MRVTANASSSGIGFPGLLTAVFAAAKVFGFVSWSWWVVFSPLLIMAAVLVAILAVIVAFGR